MKTGAFKRAAGLIVLYCGLFVLIVLLQFSKSPGLSQRIGAFSMSASYPNASSGRVAPSAGSAGGAPESVKLSYAGLSFEISPKSPAEAIAADGSASPLSLVSASKLPSGASIKLSSGVEIKALVQGGQAERFSLSASAGEGVAALRLRFASAPGLSFSVPTDASGGKRSMISSGKSYDFALGSALFDQSSGLLTLKAGDSGLALATIAPPKPVKPAAAAASGSAKLASQAPKDPEAFKAEVAAWRDKAWSGLSSARYDADKLAWKAPDGSSSFSEKALAAYVAEAALRGSYADAIVRARNAKDRYSDKLSYLTMPYLGGVYRRMTAQDAIDQAEAKRLAQLVSDKSPTLFEKEGLLRFLVDRAPASTLRDALAYFAAVDQSKLTMRQAVGLLGCIADSKALLKDDANPFASAAVADRIAAAIRKTSSGCFLATDDDGGTDLRLSLLAGQGLMAYGQAAAKPNLVGLGQGLVEGFIALADAQGLGPSRVVAGKDGSVDQKAGSILPEDVYAILADNAYYPHEVSFARDLGPGTWAWTCAPNLSVQTSGSRKVFTAGFFVGRAHYLAVYGINRFANIQLYDIDYSPDNDFESYDASGYRHDIDKGVLYLKMKHKKESEDIKLSF